MLRFTQIVYVFGNPQFIAESVFWESEGCVSKNHPFSIRLKRSSNTGNCLAYEISTFATSGSYRMGWIENVRFLEEVFKDNSSLADTPPVGHRLRC
jgi:hypothetical protein